MDAKTYTWTHGENTVTAIQTELTLGQEKKLVRLFTDFQIGDISELGLLSIKDLLGALMEQDLINEALRIVLGDGLDDEKLDAIPHSTLKEMFQDFLFINPDVKQIPNLFASGMMSALQSPPAEAPPDSPSKGSSSPSATETPKKRRGARRTSPSAQPSSGA